MIAFFGFNTFQNLTGVD